MIQEADIGVGISGVEGMQVSNIWYKELEFYWYIQNVFFPRWTKSNTQEIKKKKKEMEKEKKKTHDSHPY